MLSWSFQYGLTGCLNCAAYRLEKGPYLSRVCAQEGSLIHYNYEEEIAPQEEAQQVLGEGGFGKVLKASLRGAEVAIKVVASEVLPSNRRIESFLAEVNHVSRLQRSCDNIVKLLGFSHRPDGALCLVYELANQGCLYRLPEELSIQEALGLFKQYATGLAHMHSCRVVHADIKPGNLLLHKLPDGSFRGVIGDLGVAEIVRPGCPGISSRGTRAFEPPESKAIHGWYGFKGYVYAFGLTMCMLAGNIDRPEKVIHYAYKAMDGKGHPLSRRDGQFYLENHIMQCFKLPGTRCPLIVRRLVYLTNSCVYDREAKRPTAAELIAHLDALAALSLDA